MNNVFEHKYPWKHFQQGESFFILLCIQLLITHSFDIKIEDLYWQHRNQHHFLRPLPLINEGLSLDPALKQQTLSGIFVKLTNEKIEIQTICQFFSSIYIFAQIEYFPIFISISDPAGKIKVYQWAMPP